MFYYTGHCQRTRREIKMSIQYRKNYDVVVSGAGIAGVAAALAAARMGMRTALIEKQTLIGGLATSGLIFIYLPLCDGKGKQVTFGIAEELLKASLKYSPYDIPEEWGGPAGGFLGHKSVSEVPRYRCLFSPAGFTLALDELLKEADVDLWLDTMVCAVQKSCDNNVTAIEVENSSGRGVITGKCFVDSTGDATVVRRAGGAFLTADNYVTPWVMETSLDCSYHPVAPGIKVAVSGKWTEDYIIRNAANSKTATNFTRTVWDMKREEYKKAYASGINSRKSLYPIHLPAMPQLRKIAHIKGIENLDTGDHVKNFESSVGLYSDWRRGAEVWEIPYGTLVPCDVQGVLACGRCMAADNDAWEVFRVIPAAAVTGEISGVASALAIKNNCQPCEVKPDELRDILSPRGFKYHCSEI